MAEKIFTFKKTCNLSDFKIQKKLILSYFKITRIQ